MKLLTVDLSKNYATTNLEHSASKKASLAHFSNLQHGGDEEEEASNSDGGDIEETKNT